MNEMIEGQGQYVYRFCFYTRGRLRLRLPCPTRSGSGVRGYTPPCVFYNELFDTRVCESGGD